MADARRNREEALCFLDRRVGVRQVVEQSLRLGGDFRRRLRQLATKDSVVLRAHVR